MNNKGFAITTILYGAMILFCLLLVSLLGILSSFRSNLKLLIDAHNGAREIVTIKKDSKNTNYNNVANRGLYCQGGECKYIGNGTARMTSGTDVKLFSYTGSAQEYIAKEEGYYKVELWGSKGGGAGGANGAYTSGYIYLVPGEKLYVYVGQNFDTATNKKKFNSGTSNQGGYNGGSATDIRLVNGAWDNATSLNSRIMVAAGGGSANAGRGGAGGGLLGIKGNGTYGGTQTTFGAVQSSSYTKSSFGIANGGCSGGNGYYPGGGAECVKGAGGGSSFISGYAGVNAITSESDRTHTNNTLHYSDKYFVGRIMASGSNNGNGKARIAYMGNNFTRKNTKLDNVRYIKNCTNGNSRNVGNHWVELQAIKNGVNLALNKTVTGTVAESNTTAYSYKNIVDGKIENTTGTSGYGYPKTQGNQCYTVDLGDNYDLDEIAVWNYFADDRYYKEHVVSVSSNNSNWVTIISNSNLETADGKRVSAW